MTPDDDFIGELEAYLDEYQGVTPLPEALRRAVRLELPTTAQIGPRSGLLRMATMTAPVRFAAAAVVVAIIVFIGIRFLPSSGFSGGPSGSTMGSPTSSPGATPVATPRSDAEATPEVDPHSANYAIGRHSLTVDGVSFSFAIEKSGWEPYGTLHVSKSLTGPQGAEAVLYWAAYPDGRDADPCADLARQPAGASAADLADAVATARGTDLYTGPVDVTIGGHPAQYVALTVRDDVGCDPGFFYSWQAKTEGALWTKTRVGDTIMVWVVDVRGIRFFIVGETATESSYMRPLTSTERAQLGEQMRQIVESIRFE